MKSEKRKLVAYILIIITLLGALGFTIYTTLYASAHTIFFTHTTWQTQVGVEYDHHALQGMAFLPGEQWITVGDSVSWSANTAEPHTITFLKPGQQPPTFNDANPQHTQRQGGTHYDGHSYYNSGLLSNNPQIHSAHTYSLTFDVTGTFTYICLLHPSMIGIVHVLPVGAALPFTQNQYNQQIQQKSKTLLNDGRRLEKLARQQASRTHVIAGIGDSLVTIMRFYPEKFALHVGEQVLFTNLDTMEPHTVTFGPPQTNIYTPYGNAHAYNGTSPLNSGYIGTDAHWSGRSFQVTFVKAGTFSFRCELHDSMGMIGTVTVHTH